MLAIALGAATGHAQIIYRCKGPDGNVTFGDQPCPGALPKLVGPEPRTPVSRAESIRRWGTTEKDLASCATKA